METLGEFLQKGRREADVSLDDLADRTRIRIENLRSLEKGDLEALPSDPYVRGFVKVVCRELGLAPEEGILRYDILRERLTPPDEMTWEEERTKPARGRLERALEDPERIVTLVRRFGKATLWVSGGVVAVLLVYAAVRWVGSWGGGEDAPDRLVAEAGPPAETSAGTESPADLAPATPESDAASPESAPPESERTPEPEPAPVEPVAPPPAAETREADTREADTRAAETRVAAPREAETRAAEPPPTDPTSARPAALTAPVRPTGNRLVLRVEALRSVEVGVLLDGIGVPRTRRMAAGDLKSWKADSLFVISASDGGAIRLTLEGAELPVPGSDGVPLDRVAVRPASR